MKRFLSTWRGRTTLLLTLALGWILGALSAPRTVHACSCAEPSWTYRLEQVETPEGARDHSPYWPQVVNLFAYDGAAQLWGVERGPETLDRVSAEANGGAE